MGRGAELKMRLENRENEHSQSDKMDLPVMIIRAGRDFNRGECGYRKLAKRE